MTRVGELTDQIAAADDPDVAIARGVSHLRPQGGDIASAVSDVGAGQFGKRT